MESLIIWMSFLFHLHLSTQMQFFEALFLFCTLVLLALVCFFSNSRKGQLLTFYAALGALAIHLIGEVPRWQVGLAYVLFPVLPLLLLRNSVAHIALRVLGFLTGATLLATSMFFAMGMPIKRLPAPSGEYKVGTTSFTLVDESREEIHTDRAGDKRELFVEAWYPAGSDEDDVYPMRTLWSELYRGESDQISFFLSYLRGVKTHSMIGAPAEGSGQRFPLILFNHGLQMFTSQNTLLMEHLASHGYIVVSISHPYESLRVNLEGAGTVLPKFLTSIEEWNKAMQWIEASSRPIQLAKDSMAEVSSVESRAQIMRNAISESPMNTVVQEWASDNTFVLDNLLSSGREATIFQGIIDTTRIGAMGMSVGGATAAELCKLDPRIKAGINVDGLQYGTTNSDSLNVPFLMVYSDDGLGTNDFLQLSSTTAYHECHFVSSKHADFTDFPIIWPMLKLYGQLGSIPGPRVLQMTNNVVLGFWDRYLKDQPASPWNEDYPELTFKSHRD